MAEGRKRKRPILLFMLVGCAIVMLFIALTIGFVASEVRHANDLFSKTVPDQAIHDVLAARSEPQKNTHGTSATIAIKNPVGFAVLIQNSPDLPQKLRDARDKINQDYENVLRLLEEYEKNKNNMSWDQFAALYNQVQNGREALIKEILTCMNTERQNSVEWCKLPQTGSIGRIRESILQLVYIEFGMMAARSTKTDHPWSACQSVEGLLQYKKDEWIESKQGRYVRMADFYRERGHDDYYRTLHYYWQYRRSYGYTKVAKVVWQQFYEEKIDRKLVRCDW